MPRFRKGSLQDPLLPAPAASSLGLGKRRPAAGTWPVAAEVLPALMVAAVLFCSVIYVLISLEARRSALDGGTDAKDLPGAPVPRRRNAALEKALQAIIEEATIVAREKGILTETDAAEARRQRELVKTEDWSWMLEEGAAAAPADAVCGKGTEECGPHGRCVSRTCECAAAFDGKFCGHSVLLSPPFLPDAVSLFEIGYEGDVLLLRASNLTAAGPAVAPLLRRALPLLPPADEVFRGTLYDRCAVVGPGGGLLLGHRGAAIDAHDLVLRAGDAGAFPTAAAGQRVGAQHGVHFYDAIPEEWKSAGPGPVLARLSADNAARLRPGAAAPPPWLLHPEFETHVAHAFALGPRPPSPLLVSLVLAVNVCRSVTAYGVAPSAGLPPTHFDACAREEGRRLQREWPLVRGLAAAGLVQMGEECVAECASMAAPSAECGECRKGHGMDAAAAAAALPACPHR